MTLVFVNFKKNRGRVLVLLLSCMTIFLASGLLLHHTLGEAYFRFSSNNLKMAFSSSGQEAIHGREVKGVEGKDENNRVSVLGLYGQEYLRANKDNGIVCDEVSSYCAINNKGVARQIAADMSLNQALKESGYVIVLSRMSLLEISFQEIKKSPMLGMGPLAFPMRYYGIYPHGVILELLVEFGLLLGGLIVLGLCYVGWSCIQKSKNSSPDQGVLMLIVIYIPMFIVSGSVWTGVTLLFSLGYALTLCFDRVASQISH